MSKRDDFVKQVKSTASKVGFVADDAKDRLIKGGKLVAEQADQFKKELDYKILNPVFVEDLQNPEYVRPQMIRILDYDKQHQTHPVCAGSIGFGTETKGMSIMNLYTADAEKYGVEFYPEIKEDVYYVDPCHPNLYISLNEYFSYLKKVRVDELNQVAQDLGASYIKVTLKAEKKTFIEHKAKAGVKVKPVGTADATHDMENKQYERVEVASEMSFVGHEPGEPHLVYFDKESDIHSLIAARKNKDNVVLSKTLRFNYNKTSGIKQNDAIKIDAALKSMKFAQGNTSISNEIQEENRMCIEYEIHFPKP